MKNKILLAFILVMSIAVLPGCEAIGNIFSAGVWFGIVIVMVIIILIFWLLNKTKK